METQKFAVSGITCGSCVNKIQTALDEAESLQTVRVLRNPDRLEIESATPLTKDDINRLFQSLDLTKYKVLDFQSTVVEEKIGSPQQLFPLALVIFYLIGTVSVMAFATSDFSLNSLMSHYMGGFFLVFSFFKFLNLQGFADAFQTYDPIAKKWRPYGYFYATFELLAGVAYLLTPHSFSLNFAVLVVLSVSSWGVIKAVRSKSRIQCACLGTVFNLPMTKVTIVENVSMIAMAAVMVAYGS